MLSKLFIIELNTSPQYLDFKEMIVFLKSDDGQPVPGKSRCY